MKSATIVAAAEKRDSNIRRMIIGTRGDLSTHKKNLF